MARINAESGETDSRPCKNVSVVNDKRGKRNYISMFEDITTELPIKRVIVGPSSSQEKSFELARTLLPKSLLVTKSATPFIG